MSDDFSRIRRDFHKVFADIAEAQATGRKPEDVQRERHERERASMTRRPPPVGMFMAGLVLFAVGIVRLTKPHEWYDPGGFAVVIAANLIGWYVHRAVRWLKERP